MITFRLCLAGVMLISFMSTCSIFDILYHYTFPIANINDVSQSDPTPIMPFTKWNNLYLQNDTFAPALHFNLSGWKLQKPEAPIAVSEINLIKGYRSKYFYYDPSDKSLVFMCPNEGAHTSETAAFPRTELRHIKEFYVDKGYYYQNATLMISDTSSKSIANITQNYNIIVSQIHGTTPSLPLLKVVWYNIDDHLEAQYKLNAEDDKTKSIHQSTKMGKIARNNKFTLSIIIHNGNLSVYTNSIKYVEFDANHWYHRNYFKVGNYFHYPKKVNMWNHPDFHTEVKLYALDNIMNDETDTNNTDFPFYIFQIGFNKVGTRTFVDFFNRNGIPSVHHRYRVENESDILIDKAMKSRYYQHETVLKDFETKYMFYADFIGYKPIKANDDEDKGREYESGEKRIYLHEILLREYENAKFILNIRNINHWIRSRYLHYSGEGRSCFKIDCERRYNESEIDRIKEWKYLWYQHNCNILNYFKENDLMHSLLVFDIETDSVDKMVHFFVKYGLSLNASYWQHKGKSVDVMEERQQYQTERWNNLTMEYPHLLNNDIDLDNKTEYHRILDYCNEYS